MWKWRCGNEEKLVLIEEKRARQKRVQRVQVNKKMMMSGSSGVRKEEKKSETKKGTKGTRVQVDF